MTGQEPPIPCRVTQTVETAWTFERHGERLVLHREETVNGVNLVVVSENGVPRSYPFDSMDRLVAFQSDMESLLVRTGWSFVAFTPDRRSGRDRRGMPRESERRRWWTDGLR
jgi:hypothetical protein